ncbi:MAG: DMT family transporter [Rhodospirillales bacterium]|nr:DMT family transporter [Rhodospirillales bacterium]
MANQHTRRIEYLLMLLPPLFWAGNAVVGRYAMGAMPPVALSFWRWVLGLMLLLPFGLPRLMRQKHLLRPHWKLLVVLSATSIAAYNTLLYTALTTTTAINATLVSTTLPLSIIALSWLWLGEKLSPMQATGLVVSLAGVLTVIARGDPAVLAALELRQGDLVVLAAVASWGIYSVLLRKHPTGIDPIAMLTILVAIGVVLILPFYLWELTVVGGFTPTFPVLAVITYVAIFPSALAYYFWNRGIAALGTNLAGQFTYLLPMFTAVLATVFLGEAFRWFHSAGLVLIFSGIWLATHGRRAP